MGLYEVAVLVWFWNRFYVSQPYMSICIMPCQEQVYIIVRDRQA